jgi:hypothetical protein
VTVVDWRETNLLASRFWPRAGSAAPSSALPLDPLSRLPLAYGSRLALVDAARTAVVLAPPPPAEPIADVAAAVRGRAALPARGPAAEAMVSRGGAGDDRRRAALAARSRFAGDPRRAAIAATMLELDRAGATFDKQTAPRRRLASAGAPATESSSYSSRPIFARRFHGRVEVHDAEREDLVEIPDADRPLRVHPRSSKPTSSSR